jgi:pentatricopeptide repeat protein
MVKQGACGLSSLFGENALMRMYSICRSIGKARRMFDAMCKPDLVSWTCVITACAQNGQPEEALKYYDRMVQLGVMPDHMTFIGVLCTCRTGG